LNKSQSDYLNFKVSPLNLISKNSQESKNNKSSSDLSAHSKKSDNSEKMSETTTETQDRISHNLNSTFESLDRIQFELESSNS